MRIAVYGTGGVGGYFGGKLAQAGEDVTFIARGAHLEAIQRDGLTVQSVKGDFAVHARAERDPAAVGPVDVILIGVKSWQVPEAAQAIRPMVGPGTLVIPLENGVDAPSQLVETLGAEHALGGLCRVSSMIAAPGVIRHAGVEPYIAFNHLDGRADPRLQALCDDFTRVGVTAEVPADINAALWAKFVFICSVSGVGSVTRAPIGVQRTVPETRQMLVDTMTEIAAVGRAQDVKLADGIVDATLKMIDSFPFATTASMQRDIIDGRPSELESQNGAVVRLGAEAGVPTPTNALIYASLLPLEKRARGELTF